MKGSFTPLPGTEPKTDGYQPSDLSELLSAATFVLIQAVLDLIQVDPHQWSERPCPTCRAIGAIIKQPFGCYLYAKQKGR